jgi:Phage integrase family
MFRGKRYRNPANEFAIPRMEPGKQRPIQSMEEAGDWERLFIGEIKAGRDLLRPRSRTIQAGTDLDDVSTTWETLRLLAHGIDPKPGRERAQWNREQLEQIDLRWHDLRHEGACRLLVDGVDIRIIQLMLGHASIQQTQRYLNVTDEELRRGLQLLNASEATTARLVRQSAWRHGNRVMGVSYPPPSIGPLVHLRLPATRSRRLTVCLYPAELPIEHHPRNITRCPG